MTWRTPFEEATARGGRGKRMWRSRYARRMGRSGNGDAALVNIADVVDLILVAFPSSRGKKSDPVALDTGGSQHGHGAGQDRKGCQLESQQSSTMS